MIIVRLQGGMGNQMFQYAIGRALAIKNKTKLGLDLSFLLDRTIRLNFTFRDYSLDVFNIEAEIISPSKKTVKGKLYSRFMTFFDKFIKHDGVEKSFQFDESILKLPDGSYLNGYFQSPKYFSDIEDVIRSDFTLNKQLPIEILNLIEVIKKENSVCLHVRRGDYVGNKYHEVVDNDYYNKAISYLKQRINIDKIYIFSDDIKWCKENMKFDYPSMFVGDEYAGVKGEGHMYLMSACRYFIIPNSSFSWWSAWLGNSEGKIVISPKQWFVDENINSEDLIPKDWVRI